MKQQTLTQLLQTAATEEEIKSRFAKYFNLTLNTKHNIDLYTPEITFEFKTEVNLQNITARARTVAQALYYVRRLKYGSFAEVPSQYICIADKNNAIVLETKDFANYYLKTKGKNYDWDLPASKPDLQLVEDLSNDEAIKTCHVYKFAEEETLFAERINNYFKGETKLELKKEIDEDNFYDIFKYWHTLFGKYVEDERKSSEYFTTDIERGKSEVLENGVIFRMSGGTIIEKQIPSNEYKHFWSIYNRVDNAETIIKIRQKMDRMSKIDMRRFTGEFFTPIEFAKKALDYIERTVGVNWYKSGKYRLWDMSAGTGNLEFVLPIDALQYCYISTLLEDDAKYCKKIYPTATVFQYDYLNDDVEFLAQPTLFELGAKYKMPQKLINDLKNPNLKWIIFINPPYATASNFERTKNRKDKNDVSMTKIRDLMNNDDLGEVSRELYSQFLYRINLEFKNLKTLLGMFSTLKYINSNNDQKMRDKFFDYKFQCGFVFSSQNFNGCKGKFPIGFIVWNLFNHTSLTKQKINLDVYNSKIEKFAIKNISSVNRDKFLNKWIKRPPCNKKFPPLSNALNVAAKNKDRRDRIAEGFLASLMCNSNDFEHQIYTALLSAPYVSAGAMSITAENFEKAVIIHMVRKLPKTTWLNDRDQFMQPTKELTREFINDSVVWSLFSNSNNTTAMSNVEYEGNIYQIKNNFYPFKVSEVNEWQCNDADMRHKIYMSAMHEDNRFVADWLANKTLSAEASKVIKAAKIIYKRFYEVLNQLDCKQYKIDTYDAGWYQIRNSLKDAGFSIEEIQQPMKELGEKLLPQIYEFGFLNDDVKYFE